jgi:hypothetical protein
MTPDVPEEQLDDKELAHRIFGLLKNKSCGSSMGTLCVCLASLVEYCGETTEDRQDLYDRILRTLAVMRAAGESE